MKKIPFNSPYFPENTFGHIQEVVHSGKLSGNGLFTKKCQQFFKDSLNCKAALLTTSCTDALEMAAILINIQSGDEVIVPSFTFPSTANAFILRGGKIIFADSEKDTPNLDVNLLESLISDKTKAIVVVHYAGVACDMDAIMALAKKYRLYVIEDAAQAIDSFYKTQPLGSIGHLAAFSFHETKNISSGEGGLLAINDEQFIARAECIWEKGTNRSAFFRGEVAKYSWVDIGSSFLPSEITAALLYAQIEQLAHIQGKRKALWNQYFSELQPFASDKTFLLPHIPSYATNNAHMFYLLCSSLETRQALIEHLKKEHIAAIFHYLPLHKSQFYADKHDGRALPFCDLYSDTLLRLPLYYDLTFNDVHRITQAIGRFFAQPSLKTQLTSCVSSKG